MPFTMQRILTVLCLLAIAVFSPALLCANLTNIDPGSSTIPADWLQADFLLLGEVHDNAAGHALRLQWLRQLTAQRKVALVFEQFDLESQAALDQAVQQWHIAHAAADDAASRAVAEAAGFNFKGWKWPLYAPVLTLALKMDLPVGAANLSRTQMGAVMSGKRPAPSEPDLWGEKERLALLQEVREGHCNLMPEGQIQAMAMAQRARDYEMAGAMIAMHQRTGLPVVLLAGNGHLRKDLAVPAWLAQLATQARVISVAVLEKGATQNFDPAVVYDAVAWITPEERPDPCAALRQKLSGPPGSSPATP